MGLSRNKVAVPEGAAGTPPFWSLLFIGFRFFSEILVVLISLVLFCCLCFIKKIKKKDPSLGVQFHKVNVSGRVMTDSPIAQLVRALH